MKRFILFMAVLIVLCTVMPFSAFAAEEKLFWVTHFNDGFSEGAGAIFTETDAAGGWWLHVAFEPVDGVENTYTIVDISNGIADGSATPLAVPDGGFVWAANTGNDYISIGCGDIDYTSPNCFSAIADAAGWTVGQAFTFHGLDLENQTVPTTTPDTMWYDDAYICTATYMVYEGEFPDIDESSAPDWSDNYDEVSAESSDTYYEDSDEWTSADEETNDSHSAKPTVNNQNNIDDDDDDDRSDRTSSSKSNNGKWIVVGVIGFAIAIIVTVIAVKKA